jgi:membrane protease YdiL (CAAX protease family)
MDDKARLFGFNQQSPVIQLIISVSIVVIAGSLSFYLFVFAGSLIFGTDIPTMLSIPGAFAGPEAVSALKYIQVSQQIALFILPVIIISYFMRRNNGVFLRLNESPALFQVIMVLLLALMIMPVTSYTGILNSKMDLQGWLSGVEGWMKEKEETAGNLTNLLMHFSGAGDLVINIFILSVLPAISEELLFRGVLQQLLSRIFRSGHAGIWLTAVLFSTIHLQFYGFLPRLLLGLSFGYLFFWTGNLWIAVLAHFFNNIVPVLLSYFLGWKELVGKAAELADNKIIVPLVPAIVCIGILYYFWLGYKKTLAENKI